MRARSALLASLAVVLTAIGAEAQNVRLFASADSVYVGERFYVSVHVEVDAGYHTVFPNLNEGFVPAGDIEFIRAVDVSTSKDESVTHTDSARFEVAAFGIDSVWVGGIPVGIVSPYGDTVFATPPSLLVGIYSVVPEDAAGIKDLAPLATFPPILWPWIAGALALLAIAAVAYYLWSRRRGGTIGAMGEREPRVDPYDEAVRRLRKLSEEGPETVEEIRAYHIELSDTLRTYLEYTVNVPALERTSSELMQALRRLSAISGDLVGEDTVGRIERSLSLSDLAKFASYRPGPKENQEVLDLTRASIDAIEHARRRRLAASEPVEVSV